MSNESIDLQTQRTLKIITYAQCVGMFSAQLLVNGFYLAYLSKLGISNTQILFLLSLPSLGNFFLLIPFAYISDRIGKKRIANLGQIFSAAGVVLTAVAGSVDKEWQVYVMSFGLVVYAVGHSLFSSNWFALLSPIIPGNIRGRFFANLRFTWQTFSIICGFLITWLLGIYTSIFIFQCIVFFGAILLGIRMIFYRFIPELEKSDRKGGGFRDSMRKVLTVSGYLPFCCYTFMLMLFTGSCPWIFGLLQKNVLGFTASQLVLMGNCMAMGALGGFFLGGHMIDKHGTKPVFLVCHFSFGLVLALFCIRDWIPFPIIVTMGTLSVAFGMLQAASGTAIVSEMLALIPAENKSLSTALNITMFEAGKAISGILMGQITSLKMLNPSWHWMGLALTDYDTLILMCSSMIVLMVVTLGLIPSVIRKTQRMPD